MVGMLDGRFERVRFVGRVGLVSVGMVEDRIGGIADTLMRWEEVVGTGRVVGQTLIVAVSVRTVYGFVVEERLWDREDETVRAAETVEVGIETALEHWVVANLEHWLVVVSFIDAERGFPNLVVGYKIFAEQIPAEVALLHSHMIVELAVHRGSVEVVPLTVLKVPHSPCVLL